mgnify:CR=1 FL=1
MMILSNIIHNWCNWYQCHCFRLLNLNNIILLGASIECCINTGHNLNCNNSNTRMFWSLDRFFICSECSGSESNCQQSETIIFNSLSHTKKTKSIIGDWACKWRIIDSLMEWNNPEVDREILFIWIHSLAQSKIAQKHKAQSHEQRSV